MPVDFWKTANGLIHIATNDPDGEGFHVAVSCRTLPMQQCRS
jgi:hypothetical protein